MSASQYDEFDRRMRRITRRHTQLSRGYVTSVNDDGLVVAKPKRKGGYRTLRGLVLIVLAMMLFKGFLHASLGAVDYDARLARLENGSGFEKAGAWVMTADPATRALSDLIATYL